MPKHKLNPPIKLQVFLFIFVFASTQFLFFSFGMNLAITGTTRSSGYQSGTEALRQEFGEGAVNTRFADGIELGGLLYGGRAGLNLRF